jgi:hypothetical protein
MVYIINDIDCPIFYDFEHHFIHEAPEIALNMSEGWVKYALLVMDLICIDDDAVALIDRNFKCPLCYSHTQPDFEPGPYGIKTVSTRFQPYRPGSTRIDSHRNTCQFLRIPGATIRRRKHFVHVQNFCASQTVYKSVLNPFQALSTRM